MRGPAPTAAALLLVFAVGSGTAAAQDVEAAASAGWYDPTGGDFENTDPGPGVDGAVRVRATDRFSVGGGVQWNSHAVPFSDDDWSVLAVFAEPRLLLLSRDRPVTPVVSARAGWMRQAVDRDDGSERTASGFGLGGFVGALFQVTDRVGLEAAVPAYYLSFGDFEVDGVEEADTESSGGVWGGRIGLVVAF